MSGVCGGTFVDKIEGSLFASVFTARFYGDLQDSMFLSSERQSGSQLLCHLVCCVAWVGLELTACLARTR